MHRLICVFAVRTCYFFGFVVRWLKFYCMHREDEVIVHLTSCQQPTKPNSLVQAKDQQDLHLSYWYTLSLECLMLGGIYLGRVERIWYLSLVRAAKVQASLRIRAVSPEPPLLAHTSSETRGTFRQKVRAIAPLNGWACAVKICHDGMLEDTNSLDGAGSILLF